MILISKSKHGKYHQTNESRNLDQVRKAKGSKRANISYCFVAVGTEIIVVEGDANDYKELEKMNQYREYVNAGKQCSLNNKKKGQLYYYNGESEIKGYIRRETELDIDIVFEIIQNYIEDGKITVKKRKGEKYRFAFIFKVLTDGYVGTGFEHYTVCKFKDLLNKKGIIKLGKSSFYEFIPRGDKIEEWKVNNSRQKSAEARHFAKQFINDYNEKYEAKHPVNGQIADK